MLVTRLCWLVLVCLLGCGPSGVLVEAHAAFHLDELLLYGAVDDGQGQFVLDPRLTATRVEISTRKLAVSPYRILLQGENQDAGHQAILAVVGRRAGAAVAFAELQPPQSFHEGELLLRTLDLVEFTGPPPFDVRDTGCVEIAGATSLGSQADHDCDGYANPSSGGTDCNDENAFIHPGQREVCDGFDDNCDGVRAAGSEFCFVNAGQCLVGQRTCNDDVPPGFTSACQAGAEPAPSTYCTAYASCDAMSSRLDKLACTAETVPARLYVCELAFTATGLCPGAQFLLPGPMTGPCSWTLDGTTTRDGYTLGLLDAQMVPRTSSTSCMPLFGVTDFSSMATAGVTSAFLRVDGPTASPTSFGLLITPVTLATCPLLPLACR
jgi:hypothetical protein